MASRTWRRGNNAIVITWDDDYSDQGSTGTGCCGFDPDGGHVATIVIANHDQEHATDRTAYNRYALLKTMEQAFRLPALGHAGDASAPITAPLFHP